MKKLTQDAGADLEIGESFPDLKEEKTLRDLIALYVVSLFALAMSLSTGGLLLFLPAFIGCFALWLTVLIGSWGRPKRFLILLTVGFPLSGLWFLLEIAGVLTLVNDLQCRRPEILVQGAARHPGQIDPETGLKEAFSFRCGNAPARHQLRSSYQVLLRVLLRSGLEVPGTFRTKLPSAGDAIALLLDQGQWLSSRAELSRALGVPVDAERFSPLGRIPFGVTTRGQDSPVLFLGLHSDVAIAVGLGAPPPPDEGVALGPLSLHNDEAFRVIWVDLQTQRQLRSESLAVGTREVQALLGRHPPNVWLRAP